MGVVFRSRRSRGFDHRTVLIHIDRLHGWFSTALQCLGVAPKVYVPRSEEGLSAVCAHDNRRRFIAGVDTLVGLRATLKSQTQTEA